VEISEGNVPSRKAVRNSAQSARRSGADRASERRAYREGETGKLARKRQLARQRDKEWLTRPFVAWDGEGVTREDGNHYYLTLANSNGDRLRSMKYLRTETILNFLLTRSVKGTINVIYGASYDWNMWLSDLSRADMEQLYRNGSLRWRGFLLTWRQGKTFHVMKNGESALFYDVVSFFQCAFVKACDSYLGDEFVDRELIVQNKMLRSGFREEDLDEIDRYNEAELVNLVKLMNELRIRLHRAGLKPARWDGPGAIAVALMGREGIPLHLQQAPSEVQPAIRHAYFGGRFEVVKFGHVERKCYEYDLNSAYPWALLDVPSLAGGTWEYVSGNAGHHDFAVYHLDYRGTNNPALPQPLPWRAPNGAVAYPRNVVGWYWTPEYEVAREYVRRQGGNLAVLGAWVFHPASSVRPFSYVSTLYEQRRELKKAGDGAHVGIKLGLNSQYGKLAQQVGWRIERDGSLRIPPYHQLEWAGYVTSKCRAAVLGAALGALDKVIAFETDALFVEEKLNVTEGAGLGEWEYTGFDDITYLQSGTYFANSDGEAIDKTRGVDRGSLSRATVLDSLRNGSATVPSALTRFTAVGLALQTKWEHWRQWRTTPKNITLSPQGKRTHFACGACEGMTLSLGRFHYTVPLPVQPGTESTEYEIEWVNPGSMGAQLAELREGHYEGMHYED
jgi:hypothetical protein